MPEYIVHLDKKDIVELLYFFFKMGWISYEQHEHIHDISWRLKVEMDILYPNWEPNDLERLVKEVRNESESISS